MKQKILKVNLKEFFSLHEAQREMMIFLLQRRIDSNNLIRLHELVDYCGYNRTCSYRALKSLNGKGWIVFRKSAQIRASWVGYQDKMPAEFLRELRTSLAQAKGYGSWCDYIMRKENAYKRLEKTLPPWASREIMRTEVNRPNEGTHTAETAKPWQQQEIAATKARGRYYGSDNSDVRLPGRPHRFDPQGVPLRIVQHDTHK